MYQRNSYFLIVSKYEGNNKFKLPPHIFNIVTCKQTVQKQDPNNQCFVSFLLGFMLWL